MKILLILLAILFIFLARRRIVLAFDAVRLRGKYGVSTEQTPQSQRTVHKKNYETDVIQIAQSGLDMLATMHGPDILRHFRGQKDMMRARLESATIIFIPSESELRVLSVSGDLADIITATKRIAADLGQERITQIRVCCASNPEFRKALIKLVGATKTGIRSELIIR